jgi:hypothetical protein
MSECPLNILEAGPQDLLAEPGPTEVIVVLSEQVIEALGEDPVIKVPRQ